MVMLGKARYSGKTGTGGRDYGRALHWWKMAGQRPAALYYLGALHVYGRGVHSDWGRAETYFAAAARLGHPDGARMAATMRDLHVDLNAVKAGEDFNALRCGTAGGTPVGMACFKSGEMLW